MMNHMRAVAARIAGVLMAKDNAGVQGLQVRSPYQDRSNVKLFGHHGLISRPLPGAQVLLIEAANDPSKVIAVATHDPRYYRAGLADGDVGLGHHLGAHVLLLSDRIEIDGGGQLVVIKNASKVRMECDLEVTGEVKAMCDGAFVTLSQHKGHTGGGQPPTPST